MFWLSIHNFSWVYSMLKFNSRIWKCNSVNPAFQYRLCQPSVQNKIPVFNCFRVKRRFFGIELLCKCIVLWFQFVLCFNVLMPNTFCPVSTFGKCTSPKSFTKDLEAVIMESWFFSPNNKAVAFFGRFWFALVYHKSSCKLSHWRVVKVHTVSPRQVFQMSLLEKTNKTLALIN